MLKMSITGLLSVRKSGRKLAVVGACRPVIDWGVQGISAMGFNQRRMARERAAIERAEQERGQRELGRYAVQAEKLVAIWNSRAARRARPSFYPTIETALLAGAPWLAYQCPSCQLIGDVDLRTLDRHPLMAISGLIPSLSCRWCCSNPPFAKLIGLTGQSTVAAAVRRRQR